MGKIIIWSIAGLFSFKCIYNIFSQEKHMKYDFIIGLIGLTSGYIRGYTDKDILTNLIEMKTRKLS